MNAKKKFNNLQEVLNYIQVNLNAPKNQYNKFGGYKYRSCEDILSALKPLLAETGAILTTQDDIALIGERFYIKATVTLAYNGETVTSVAYAREPENKKGMDEAQITGASSSYARKYALNGLFAIDDTKDPDFYNTHGKEDAKQEKPKPQSKAKESKQTAKKPPKQIVEVDESTKLRRELFAVLNKNGRDQIKFKKWLAKEYNTESTTALKIDDLKYIIGGIEHGYWKEEF